MSEHAGEGRAAGLRLAVAQPLIRSRAIEANAVAHAELIERAEARVVVFPELSLTGYELDASPVRPDDDRLAAIVAACAHTGALALVGAPVGAPGDRPGTSIGLLAVDGDGVSTAYRKLHLGADEVDHMVPGEEPAVLEVDGWRLGLAICKDTGVVEHAAATAALDIDVYVAGVLEHEVDRDVQPARAARVIAAHRIWVAVASFAGSTGGGFDDAAGRSAIWRPDGTAAAMAGRDPGAIAVAELTLA